jgi:hypothetical protein
MVRAIDGLLYLLVGATILGDAAPCLVGLGEEEEAAGLSEVDWAGAIGVWCSLKKS